MPVTVTARVRSTFGGGLLLSGADSVGYRNGAGSGADSVGSRSGAGSGADSTLNAELLRCRARLR